MPHRVVRYEETPNPNAVKCWLDGRISDGATSFRSPAEAKGNPLAEAIFAATGATSLLLFDDWMTINKPAEARWPAVRKALERVLSAAPGEAPPAAVRESGA